MFVLYNAINVPSLNILNIFEKPVLLSFFYMINTEERFLSMQN
ncbi:hypothetical protein SD78_4031 [Bacillus badius]|nr:hypothetical protein SD78_4031 [Bacillus badius]